MSTLRKQLDALALHVRDPGARAGPPGGEARLFSALKKQGLDEVATLLWRWTHEAPAAPVVAPDTAPEDEPPALD